jgi:hypothetical protein
LTRVLPKDGTVYLLGGTAAVAVAATLGGVANKFFTTSSAVTVASGVSFAGALRGGGSMDGTPLLADPARLAAPASTYLASVRTSPSTAKVVGGTKGLQDPIVSDIKGALGR